MIPEISNYPLPTPPFVINQFLCISHYRYRNPVQKWKRWNRRLRCNQKSYESHTLGRFSGKSPCSLLFSFTSSDFHINFLIGSITRDCIHIIRSCGTRYLNCISRLVNQPKSNIYFCNWKVIREQSRHISREKEENCD